MSIYDESPWHFIVETILILFIIYILLAKRTKGPDQRDKLKLSSKYLKASEICGTHNAFVQARRRSS